MSEKFWVLFRGEIQESLGHRAESFIKIFEYLDTLDHPVVILETGCLRELGSWGDGQSTMLFDLYAQHSPGSRVYSVNTDVAAVAVATKCTSGCTTVTIGESVDYLSTFEHAPDLVYLDSFDLDVKWPLPSAVHHLKELAAIMPKLTKESLVVVDDSVMVITGIEEGTTFRAVLQQIGGKGRFVAEYAEAIGVKPLFTGWQCGWLNLARRS